MPVDQFCRISDDLTIRYQRSGIGKLHVVFIPGWTMSVEVFQAQLEHFSGSTEYTAIAYDPRAQGLSTPTKDGHFYEQHARDLHRLLEQLNVESFVLAPWSAGAGTAFEFVRLYGTHRLKGLFVIDSCPVSRVQDKELEWGWFGLTNGGDQDGSMRLFSHLLLMDREETNKEFVAWMLENPSPENTRLMAKLSNRTGASTAALLNLSYWFLDNTKEATQLHTDHISVHYLLREDWVSLARSWLSRHTPSATCDGLGKHMMFWDRPIEFNTRLEAFLSPLLAA